MKDLIAICMAQVGQKILDILDCTLAMERMIVLQWAIIYAALDNFI